MELTTTFTGRERLVQAAAPLLHEHPYHAVGVQALCDKAGIPKGSFYHWFRSKEELTIAALDGTWERLRKELEPMRAGCAGTDEAMAPVIDACLESRS